MLSPKIIWLPWTLKNEFSWYNILKCVAYFPNLKLLPNLVVDSLFFSNHNLKGSFKTDAKLAAENVQVAQLIMLPSVSICWLEPVLRQRRWLVVAEGGEPKLSDSIRGLNP